MIQIMFETFDVPAFYLANQEVLSLYTSVCETGIAVDIGNSIYHFVPVYDGFSIQYASLKNPWGHRDIDI